NLSPEWSFIPELGTAGLIFRSRIRTLVNFMKFVYLDKKDRVRAWFTPRRSMALAGVAGALALLPLWHETGDGRFVLEAANRAVVRNLVPGTVAQVYADEGQRIMAGAPLVQLHNAALESKLARSRTDSEVANARAATALLHYADLGAAASDRERLARQTDELAFQVSKLDLRSPISGVVLTPRLGDILGKYLVEGTELVEVADLNTLRARVYLSEHDMYKLRSDAYARLQIDGMFGLHEARVLSVAPVSAQIPAGLIDLTKYKGLRPPNFYAAELLLPNPHRDLRPGMIGTARFYARRTSLARLAWKSVTDFLGRKMW
ncbi:MAG: efflux RND transporter periplasmic adaptor subunit, partial [Candidatus Sulfotelmatobacter sp.]